MTGEHGPEANLESTVQGNDVPELTTLQEEVEEANRKGGEYLRLLQRVQADFANYRRRIEEERSVQARTQTAEVILRFLPVLDDFDRALTAIPPDMEDRDWVQGIELIRRKLWNTMEAEGVRPIEAVGQQFDPWKHEAVIYEERVHEPEGNVLAVVREGYTLDGRVIRPAQVIVAR